MADDQRQRGNVEKLGSETMLQQDVVADRCQREARFVVRAGVLLGDDDRPLPSMLGTMIK